MLRPRFIPGLSLFYCVFSLYFTLYFAPPGSSNCSSCGEINPSCQHFNLILQRVNQKKKKSKLIAVARYSVSGRWRVNSELIPELTDYLPIFPHTEPRGITDQLVRSSVASDEQKNLTWKSRHIQNNLLQDPLWLFLLLAVNSRTAAGVCMAAVRLLLFFPPYRPPPVQFQSFQTISKFQNRQQTRPWSVPRGPPRCK